MCEQLKRKVIGQASYYEFLIYECRMRYSIIIRFGKVSNTKLALILVKYEMKIENWHDFCFQENNFYLWEKYT